MWVTRAVILLAAISAFPSGGAAQDTFVLQGRVVEAGTMTGIQNAVVSIDGVGAVLTTGQGAFRIGSVRSGTYAVRVTALGYAPTTRNLTISANASITIALAVAPIALDGLTVRNIELEGVARDGRRGTNLVGAEVLADGDSRTETDGHGRFDVRALEGVAVEVGIRAFGYLPLDTGVRAREDVKHTFILARDPLIEAMIGVEIERLEVRSRGRRAVMFRSLNRESLLDFAGSHTLMTVLESEYGGLMRRVKCVMLDEEQLQPHVDLITLRTMLPEEVERIEFLYSGKMLRIYTQRFIQEMIARQTKLGQPSYFEPPGSRAPPLCA
jgi:hypothetical protein